MMKTLPMQALSITLSSQVIIVFACVTAYIAVSKFFNLIVIYPLIVSYLLGAGIFVLANAYFTIYAFWYHINPQKNEGSANANYNAPYMLSLFNKGQKGKFILSAVMFAVLFKFYDALKVPDNVLALFIGYFMLAFSQWLIAKKVVDKVLL